MVQRKNNFKERVLNVVRTIPKGSVLSYKEIAKKAGSPNAARAVGYYMRNNFDTQIPCHRVVRSDGRLGEYNRGGTEKKRELLLREGYRTKVI